MLLNIEHTTEYQYSQPQRMVVQSHRLYPSDSNSQKLNYWNVESEGATFGEYFFDGAGDRIRTMTVNNYVETITIKISGVVETFNNNGVSTLKLDTVMPLVYLRSSAITNVTDSLKIAAQNAIFQAGDQALDQAHAMTSFINQAIQYIPGTTTSASSADDALAQGQGVCQDQTHCLITLARINNIPARYVTGYLFTDANEQQHDASHAWAELYIENLGWVGFDATNNCCPDDRYVRIGCGIDAQGAALIRGISRGIGTESMATSVKIMDSQQ